MVEPVFCTTKEIIFDANNLPADISQVEWVLREHYDALAKRVEELEIKKKKAGISGRFGENFNEYYYVMAQERAKELAAAKAEVRDRDHTIRELHYQIADHVKDRNRATAREQALLEALEKIERAYPTSGERMAHQDYAFKVLKAHKAKGGE